ncbi:MAG: PAS domain S-box protein [Desulfobacula sp.]|nr:PAS domain S-box protein [Desulfobacula sp.]
MKKKPTYEELKKRVQELTENQEKYELINETIAHGVQEIDTTGKILFANSAFHRMCGYNPGALIGKSIYDLFPEDTDLKVLRDYIKILIQEQPEPEPWFGKMIKKNGNLFDIQTDWNYKFNSHGNVIGFISIISDITKRKQAKEELLLNQKQFDEIHKIGVLANSTLSLEVILQNILKNTLETVNASAGMIFLKDNVTGHCSWGASIGLSQNFVTAYENQHIQPGEGLTGRIAQTGESIYIPEDSSHDPRIARSVIAEEKLNTFIGVPVYAEDEIVGVMNILTRQPDILKERDVSLCSTIGTLVGSAIRNAQLYTNQKRLNTALQKNKERFKLFADASMDALFFAKDGICLEANQVAADMFGYDSPSELIGIFGTEIIAPESHEIVKEHMLKNLHAPYEAVGKQKDGTCFPIAIQSKTMPYKNKGLVRMTSILDITEQKKLKNSLKSSEKEMESIFRAAPTGIGVVCDRALQQVNDRFCEMVGYSKNEVIGKNARILYPSDEEYEYVGKKKYKQISEKGTGTVETKMLRKDGNLIDVLLSSTPIDLNDLSKGVTFTTLDITENKRVLKKLKESEERYRVLANNTQAAVVVHSADTSVIDCNPKAYELLGLKQNQITGRTAFDPRWNFLNSKGNKMPIEQYPVNQVLTTQQQVRFQTIGILRPNKDGLLWVLVSVDCHTELRIIA